MRKLKLDFIYIALLMFFYAPVSFAVNTQFANLFQTDPGTDQVLLKNNIFDRDTYNAIGAEVTLTNTSDQDGYYTVPAGSKWTWQFYRIEDETGTPVNQLIAEHSITYLGQTDNCSTAWSNGHCTTASNWSVWWTFPCMSDGRYRIRVLFNGSTVGEDDFSPTRYAPFVYATYSPDLIRPKLLGDDFASKAMPTIDTQIHPVFIQVAGLAGNQWQCIISLPNATVKLTNTVTPGSGGHAHFSSDNELGTGSYYAFNPGDIIDPDTSATNGTVVEGKTRSNGIFYTFYTAGEFGVNETITVEARRDATEIHTELKSDPVTYTMDIKAPNLVEMLDLDNDGDFKFNNGTTCNHNPTARWVVPGMRERLALLTAAYEAKFGNRLSFNDASLPFGGVFDSKNNTGRNSLCHESHRRGNDIDLNQWDEIGKSLYTKDYSLNGVFYNRLKFITEFAFNLNLEKLVEDSIHYRYINY